MSLQEDLGDYTFRHLMNGLSRMACIIAADSLDLDPGSQDFADAVHWLTGISDKKPKVGWE